MKKTFTILFVLNCLTISTFGQTIINSQKIDSLITTVEKENIDIGAVSIFKEGKEVYNRNFNHKVIDGNKAPKNLKYHIGSTTKMLTATMIFQLIEENKLKLNDILASYFPDIPNAENITIGHLLSHSSGLADYVVKQDTLYFWLKEPVSEKEIFDEIKRQGTLFQPGDSVSYSNTGYYLLTKILEKEQGKKYKEILAENITDKLNLTDTYSISEGNHDSTIAKSYELDLSNNHWNETEEFYFPNVIGVGDVVSTPKELNIFINALFSGKLISEESLNNMKPTTGQLFGKGLMRVPFNDLTFYGHGGDTYGTHSIVVIKDDFSISYIINGEYYPTNKFAIDLLSTIFIEDFEIPEYNSRYEADPNTYYKYEGIYSSEDFPFKLKIFKEDNLLKAQALATGQVAFTISPYAKNKFQFIQAGIEIEFLPEKNKLIFNQGQKIILTKEK